MRVLVTGAAGLVGSAAARELIARGHAVRALVHTRPPPAGSSDLVTGSVRDPAVWACAVDGMDAVVHAAGSMSQDPTALAAALAGTRLGCTAARASGCGRFVLLSSSAVYAPGAMLAAGEETPVGPADPYGRNKLAEEDCARCELGGALTILRPVSVVAADRPSPFRDTLRRVVESGRIPVVGDGTTPLDLVHASDLARAIAAAVEGRGAGGVFNVAGPAPAPYLELVLLASRVLGIAVETVALADGDHADFPRWLCEVARVPRTVSCARARRDLGYAPVRAWTEVTVGLAARG